MRRFTSGARRLLFTLAGAAALVGACASRPRPNFADASERQARALVLAADAERAHASGNPARAIDLNREALALDPELAGAWNNLGVCLMEQRNYVDAAQAFKAAADRSPQDPTPYENLGLVYSEAGWEEEAIRYYTLALERSPSSQRALRGYTQAAARLVRSDERTLDVLRRGVMLESDPQWLMLMQRQALRVEQDLREQARSRGR